MDIIDQEIKALAQQELHPVIQHPE
jgi:hypothetical protein